MSLRTSEANRAISAAWEKERTLVEKGRGTRNWTPKQQRDILTKGKAYDQDGKAFEGHHMKSAEAYPKDQGKAENVQFLTRTEHQAAHQGNFRNPTNGYYDPRSGKTKDFGKSSFTPCRDKKLSEAVVRDKGSTPVFEKNALSRSEQKIKDDTSERHIIDKLNGRTDTGRSYDQKTIRSQGQGAVKTGGQER